MTLTGGGAVDLTGGVLKGTGTINGPVFNIGGTVSPGDSPGNLTITGNYAQTGSSLFDVVLGGYTQGVNYDLLTVDGTASLAGTMEVDLINGFVPKVGDTFTFLTSSVGVTGAFSAFTSNDPFFTYAVNYGTGNNVVEITVDSVPEPGSAVFAAITAAFLLGRRRRSMPPTSSSR